MGIAANLKILREHGTKEEQVEIAERAGISVSAVGNFENARQTPGAETLRRLADALLVPIQVLYMDDDAEALIYARKHWAEIGAYDAVRGEWTYPEEVRGEIVDLLRKPISPLPVTGGLASPSGTAVGGTPSAGGAMTDRGLPDGFDDWPVGFQQLYLDEEAWPKLKIHGEVIIGTVTMVLERGLTEHGGGPWDYKGALEYLWNCVKMGLIQRKDT